MAPRPEILALIPARGGSKSIPRKNLLMLAGKPLIAHSIEQALASSRITRAIVSTDDDEIAEVARKYGADVPFVRPPEFATDTSPDIDVFRHALETLRDRDGYACDVVVHLRPTGPVRRVERIDEAIDRFLARPDADSLRSVSPAAQTPFKMWQLAGDFMAPVMQAAKEESYCLPRQSLPPVYWQNGYVDIVRPSVILEHGLMCGSRIVPFVMDDAIYELDYPEQIAAADAALTAMARDRVTLPLPRQIRHAV